MGFKKLPFKQAISRNLSQFLPPTIKNVLSNCSVNTKIEAHGWIKTIRKQKSFWFAEIYDGTLDSTLQTVISTSLISKDDSQYQKLSAGTSVKIYGTLVKSLGREQSVELFADNIEILGECPTEFYPIQKVSNSPDYLRTNCLHFRLRTPQHAALTRLKSSAMASFSKGLLENEFIQILPPILTEHDCEGGGEAFSVEANRQNYFSKPAYLSVSTQLHLEMAAASLPRVFSFCPVFRAENQHTTRHLSEFWMLECEISFIHRLEQLLHFTESLLKSSLKPLTDSSDTESTLDHAKVDSILSSSFGRISYTDAIKELQKHKDKFQYPLKWGSDLKTEHEKYLASQVFNGPVFVIDYPKDLKPFYMKANSDDVTVACYDLLLPGIGEIVGGSLREDNFEKLESSINDKLGYSAGKQNPLQWYLDLRRFGGVPHGGFGVGFDRFLQYISGTHNIRDIVMIPRYSGAIQF